MQINLFESQQQDENRQYQPYFEQSSNLSMFSSVIQRQDLFQKSMNLKFNEIKDLDVKILKALSLYHQAKEEYQLLDFTLLQSSIMSQHVRSQCHSLEISIQTQENNLRQIEEQIAELEKNELILTADTRQKKRSISFKVKSLQNAEFDLKKAIHQYDQIEKKQKSIRQSLAKKVSLAENDKNIETELASLKIKMKSQFNHEKLSNLKTQIKKEQQKLRKIQQQISVQQQEYEKLRMNNQIKKNGSNQSVENVFCKMNFNNESTFLKSTENNQNCNNGNQLRSIQNISLVTYFEKSVSTSYRANKNTMKRHNDHKFKKK